MKNLFFAWLLLISFSLPTKAQQRFKAGLKAGLSTSQVAGDNYNGYHKAGFDGGGFVNGEFSKNWSAQFEIIYIQKGSKHNPNQDNTGDLSYYLLQLDYLEVPVLFQYHYKKFVIEAGPAFGYLVKEKEYTDYAGDITGIRPFDKKEVSFNIGLSYRIFDHLGINCKYCNSLLAIRKFPSGASIWYNPGEINNVLAFTLTYQFGHEESK